MNNLSWDRPDDAAHQPSYRILIADDTPTSRELLRSILESSRYNVIEAENGEEALEKAALFKPDLVILDLQMPKLDGCPAAAALRRVPAFKEMPIVALTAASPGVVPGRVAEAGFSRYLVKPIGPARLRKCIRSLL